MKRVIFGAVLAALIVLSFLAGHWYTLRKDEKNTAAGRRILYYVDPMNPAHTSDKPGIAPCGMNMEPVYADDASSGQSSSAPMTPGTVKISPEKQQVIGVKTAVVQKAAVNHAIRTVGRVAPDEKRVYRLVAGTDGWIRETYDNDTGTLVQKDERLAAFYSPQFRAAQIGYLALFGGDDRSHTGGRTGLAPSQQLSVSVQTYVDTLESLGMSQQQIKELAQTRQLTDKVYIVAPATGFILARNVSPGQRFEKGAEWYRIADLSRVWVLADLFRNEAAYVKPGMKVKVNLPHENKEFQAAVSKVLPQFDPNSRTLKVRLELDNPGYALRPDMFVDVEFRITLPPAITVPTDAIIDSGMKKTVFVDRGNGFFEPRHVETGGRIGDRVEIKRGLMAGERIVVSGAFLIDSESRMKMAAAGMQASRQTRESAARAKDIVCGMEVDQAVSRAAGLTSEYKGKTYYFCMAECKQEFEKKPEQYVEDRGKGQGSRVQEQRETRIEERGSRAEKQSNLARDRGKGQGSRVQEETHPHASSGHEHDTMNQPEKTAASDPTGAHAPGHGPAR